MRGFLYGRNTILWREGSEISRYIKFIYMPSFCLSSISINQSINLKNPLTSDEFEPANLRSRNEHITPRSLGPIKFAISSQ